MSEAQTLFLVVSLLYLSDCLIWIGMRTVVFSASWSGRWRISFANDSFGNANGSLVFLHPLLPFRANYLGHWLTMSMSPVGICDYGVQAYPDMRRMSQTGKVFTYEEIQEVSADGKYLTINHSRFTQCGSAAHAQHLAALLTRLRTESVEKRAELIRAFIEKQFAKREARSRLSDVNASVATIRWLCLAFFILLYVATPLMVHCYGLSRLILPVALLMLISALCIAFLFSRAYTKLFPAQSFERVSSALKMICCPPVAIRAVDAVTIHAMERFHPLLLADLLHGSDTMAFSRAAIRNLAYPIRHEFTDHRALPIVSWHTDCELLACTHFLATHTATEVDDLLAPPSWDGVSSAYCPRCLCQFRALLDECPDCPGVKLVPFSATIPSLRGDL